MNKPNISFTSLNAIKRPSHVPMHKGDNDDGKFGGISPMIRGGEDIPDNEEENIQSPEATGLKCDIANYARQINTSENHQSEKAGLRKISLPVNSRVEVSSPTVIEASPENEEKPNKLNLSG